MLKSHVFDSKRRHRRSVLSKLKYFFPDSQDFIDPSFDFLRETRNEHRVRQRDDLYPHEVFPTLMMEC